MDSNYLSPEEIQDWEAYKNYPKWGDFKSLAKERMKNADVWTDQQMAGKRWPIGCVSLEITQRCNLDCTLCYLSDNSEAVKDIPLQEVFRRIDMIYRHYGPGTDVQVSGGDPTLRNRKELIQIVKRISDHGMKASLFTNGILARRDLIEDLAEVGLVDIAFHVDMTQERKGYNSEMELNEIRKKYIERAKGTGVNVFFNTTVFADNFKEIPQLVEFFCQHAEDIQLASFQLQADTGRGVLRKRDFIISQETLAEQISKGAGTEVVFGVPWIGHPKCNKYGIVFESNGKVFNFLDEDPFLIDIINKTADFNLDRENKWKTVLHMVKTTYTDPKLWLSGTRFGLRKLWQMKKEILLSRGKVNKITFFIHNFMDAQELDRERCESCVFMVATPDGPMSMCVHNAKRDDYILKKIKVTDQDGRQKDWNPLTGDLEEKPMEDPKKNIEMQLDSVPLKKLKGRKKKEALKDKEAQL